MAKIYTEKERALEDWDDQYNSPVSELLWSGKTKVRLTDEELRVFIQESNDNLMDLAIDMPSTKYLTYAMLITVIEAIAANNRESFDSVLNELSEMRVGKKISKIS